MCRPSGVPGIASLHVVSAQPKVKPYPAGKMPNVGFAITRICRHRGPPKYLDAGRYAQAKLVE